VATTNRDKVREILPHLAGLSLECLTLGDLPPTSAPVEDASTFEGNARLKALHYACETGLLTVAEDSGLEIDALGGRPGVESARFGGAEASYARKFELIRDALAAARAPEHPRARFVCTLSLVDATSVLFEARGTIEGTIAPEPRGGGGFGYDPIFFYPPFGCTLAEAGERKSSVSHRAEAFRKLRQYLEVYLADR
jgi:XTP/dITP diphosphohydrolase